MRTPRVIQCRLWLSGEYRRCWRGAARRSAWSARGGAASLASHGSAADIDGGHGDSTSREPIRSVCSREGGRPVHAVLFPPITARQSARLFPHGPSREKAADGTRPPSRKQRRWLGERVEIAEHGRDQLRDGGMDVDRPSQHLVGRSRCTWCRARSGWPRRRAGPPRIAPPRIRRLCASTINFMNPCVSPFSTARLTWLIGRTPDQGWLAGGAHLGLR